MKTRFVKVKTTYVYEAPGNDAGGHDKRAGVLIFGDEVAVSGHREGTRCLVDVRGRTAWVEEADLCDERALECYFIDVGTGDSTFIVTPGGKKILIDGGLNRRARGFLTWKYRLDEVDQDLEIDLLVLTHADDDHLAGLAPIISHPRIRIKRIIHSGIATYAEAPGATALGTKSAYEGKKYLITHHSELSELMAPALSPGFRKFYDAVSCTKVRYQAVDSTTPDLDIGDPAVRLEVLGPRLVAHPTTGQPCHAWFGSESETINGNSVVLRLTYKDVSMLLPGDINRDGALHLLADPEIKRRISAHVLKAPHHGSHQFAPQLLELVRPQISIISSGGDRDHGHPRAIFLGAVSRCSRSETPLVFATEIAANFSEIGVSQPQGEDSRGEEDREGGDARAADAVSRRLFKRRLHGMINVRTDGTNLYAARRVAASYVWEAYGPMPACR